MKTVSKIAIVFLIILISCNKKSDFRNKISILNSNKSYINFEADSVYYKLGVGYENEKYYQDEKSNLLFLVTREVFVLDKNFGGFKQANLTKAKNYAIKNSNKFDGGNVYLVTKISVKKKNGNYQNVWIYKNPIDFDKDNSYSIYELKIFLEDSYAKYNNKVQGRLHINFKTINHDNGFLLYTLNYINENNQWQLISREKICTIPNEVNREILGYCIDTINDNCVTKANNFELTNDYIFRFSHENCN